MRFLCRAESSQLASVLQDASLGANFSLGKMATLSLWLIANVGTEARRDEVRAVVESLDDLRWLCDDMLSEHLNLEAWAPVARERFLAAWRELKGGGAAARRRSPPPPGPPAQEAAPAPTRGRTRSARRSAARAASCASASRT